MNKRIFYRTSLTLIPVLFTLLSFAQSKTTVKATADRLRILIGEPVKIILEADIPENEPIRFFQLDTLPHFEFLNKEKIDTVNTGTGTALRQVVYITSFDSGHWVIPALALTGDIATDSIPIDVVFSAFDPQQAYHDVKDIIEVNPEEKKKQPLWWYAVGGAALVLLVLFIFWLRRKKKPLAPVVVVPVDPYKEAMEQLEALQLNKPESKLYYSRLVDVFRVYIARKKGIHSLQHTTDDLVSQLRGLSLPKEEFEQLSKSLRLSDFVKFAKYQPLPEDDTRSWQSIQLMIRYIEQAN